MTPSESAPSIPGLSIRIDRASLYFNAVFRRWYCSEDGVSWHGLPRRIRNAQTAINWTAHYYGLEAVNRA